MATDGAVTGFGVVAWSDATLDAQRWFMLANVTPLQAAMLLCEQNPNEDDAEGQAERVKTDRTAPRDFRALRAAFQGLTAPAGQATDLETWVRLARGLGLHYHPWVDAYMAAADLPALKAQREAALAAAFRQPMNDDEQAGNGAAGPVSAVAAAVQDYAELATRKQLITVFGAFTGMSMAWFKNLTDTPALLKARKVRGVGARGKTKEPLFCLMEVVLWLIDPKRKKGRAFVNIDKPWELLEQRFPVAYAKHSHGDPREEPTG